MFQLHLERPTSGAALTLDVPCSFAAADRRQRLAEYLRKEGWAVAAAPAAPLPSGSEKETWAAELLFARDLYVVRPRPAAVPEKVGEAGQPGVEGPGAGVGVGWAWDSKAACACLARPLARSAQPCCCAVLPPPSARSSPLPPLRHLTPALLPFPPGRRLWPSCWASA